MPSTIYPFSKPLYVMLKPMGAVCNLDCTYCYYLEKQKLYGRESKPIMTDDTLRTFMLQYLESQTMQSVLFTWHGGEPLLRSIDFYERAITLQQQYARKKRIQIGNSLQTNGTLLNDEWCRFFKINNFLIGISLDGNKEMHNFYRKDKAGRDTFGKVLQGIELLKKHGVEYNILATVNSQNVDHPLEVYHFFKDTESRYIQFSPVVETTPDGKLTPWSVTASKWGEFLISIFNEWVRKDVGTYFIQHFDSALANWMNVNPGICIFAETCGHAGVMEFNGDVYSCDHFVSPQYRLGNIRRNTLTEMMYSQQQINFGQSKAKSLSDQCRQCAFLFACRGECPKNWIAETARGEKINYLCEGYYAFFKHIAPYMDYMKKELEAQRPPSSIISYLAQKESR